MKETSLNVEGEIRFYHVSINLAPVHLTCTVLVLRIECVFLYSVSDLSSLFPANQLNIYNVIITSTTQVLFQPVIAPFNNIFLPYNGAGKFLDTKVSILHSYVKFESKN